MCITASAHATACGHASWQPPAGICFERACDLRLPQEGEKSTLAFGGPQLRGARLIGGQCDRFIDSWHRGSRFTEAEDLNFMPGVSQLSRPGADTLKQTHIRV